MDYKKHDNIELNIRKLRRLKLLSNALILLIALFVLLMFIAFSK